MYSSITLRKNKKTNLNDNVVRAFETKDFLLTINTHLTKRFLSLQVFFMYPTKVNLPGKA